MKSIALSLAVLLAAAPAAPAQEGATPEAAKPARHENKVSAEARALFEKMEKMAYNPVSKGLKEMKAGIKMKMDMGDMGGGEEMPGMEAMGMSFAVDFKAPKTLEVTAKGGEMFGPEGADGMKRAVRETVLRGLGVVTPPEDEEYDAEVVTEEGRKFLLMTMYEKAEKQGSMKMALPDSGPPTSGTMVMLQKMPGGRTMEQKGKMTWTYAKEGDLYRLEKMVIEVPQAPAPVEYTVTYTETQGFKVPTKIQMDMGGMKFGFTFTSLTVNGKEVALPGAARAPAAGTPTPKPAAPDEDEDGGEDEDEDEGDDDEDEGDDDQDEDEDAGAKG